MKEIQEIINKISQFAPGEQAILATVVDVVGSGYRRPGARMLIDKNGYGIGTVSGGCLEADVLERAKKVLQTGEAIVITYDTTQDENSVFGLSMGCRGIVQILLEPIDEKNHLIEYLSICLRRRKPGRIATVIDSQATKSKVGYRFFEDGLSDFDAILATNDFGKVFVETIKPPIELKLFGVGFDALPLIKFAKELGWRVTAIDHRAAFANAERLPEVDEIIVSPSENLPDEICADENSVAVIMTHNYDRDREILPRLLKSKFLYIGALGPKTRTEKILAETNQTFSAEQLENLHAPIGLDIGADTPEAIALSIVAEIQAVLAKRAGGFLRERKGSIYGRSE